MRIFAFLLFIPAAFGQLFSYGLKVGVPVTDAFATARLPYGVANFGFADSSTDAKKYLIGPMIELHLPFGFSINADGIYRPLRLVDILSPVGQTFGTTVNSANYSSWEVTPALRYRFLHLPIVKPFAEAGPSFRFLDSALKGASDRGFTLGAGVEVKILKLRIAPELRYIRWGSDKASAALLIPFQANQNQAEFLAGFSF